MRRFSLAMMCLAAAGLMTMVSCRKPNMGNNVPGEGRNVTFNAVTESNGGSKTYIEGLDVKWSANDVIYVNGTGTGNQLTLASEPGSTFGSFSSQNFTATAPYMVGYPEPTKIDESEITFTIPADQSSYNNGDGYDLERMLPMAAYTTDGNADLAFKNMVNILKLDFVFNDNQKVNKIEVECATEGLSGDFTVGSDLKPTVVSSNTATRIITSTVSLSSTSMMNYAYIMLPVFSTESEIIVTITGKKVDETPGSQSFRCVLPDSDKPNHVYTGNITVDLGIVPEFTVNQKEGIKVKFSHGNLQFNNTATPKWRMAENQWDMLDVTTGEHDAVGYSDNSGVWIDLFGWGTTNYNYRGVSYAYNYHPWNTETFTSSNNWFSTYGPERLYLSVNEMSDWGFNFNTEYENNNFGGWRTLSVIEWGNLLGPDGYTTEEVRTNAINLRGWRTLTDVGVSGLVILPDNTPEPATVLAGITNIATLEAAKAVFLPAAGDRDGTKVNRVGTLGYYWSSSSNESPYLYCAWMMCFSENRECCVEYVNPMRYYGLSVRLVREVE